MRRHPASGLVLVISVFVLLVSSSLSFAPHNAVAQGDKPTPGVKVATPQAGGTSLPTPQKPEVTDNSDQVKASVTFDDLLKKYPTLKAYLDKLDAIQADDFYKQLDYKELYQQLAMIYKDFGSTGVAVFLEESYIAEDLNVPVTFFDLVMRFQDGGFDKIVEQATKEDLIDNDEIVAYLAIFPPEQLDAVKVALKKAGISVYEYDDQDEVLDIGIPIQLLRDLKTPDAILQFLATVGNMDGIDEFFAPETELEATPSK